MLGAVPGLRILACSDNYPAPDRPTDGTFFASLLERFAARGAAVDVIAPGPWLARSGLAARPPGEPDAVYGRVAVHRPRYVSLSNRRIAGISTRRLGLRAFDLAVRRTARRLHERPDVAWAHFLFQGGHALLPVARALGVPAVVALGESTPERYAAEFGAARVARTLRGFDVVVAVSARNREWALDLGAAPERVTVVPNAADLERFRPLDRATCRRELGLPAERPIVAFVGRRIERKGPLRVAEALAALPDAGAVYLGEGPQTPTGPQVLHVGAVSPEALPRWLGACDVVALPTRAEGSPNAIAEALACGRAVVASDLPAVRDLVDQDCARLVAADDVQALGSALRAVLEDPALRARMEAAARRRAESFGLEERAAGLLARLEELASLDPLRRGD